MTRYEIHVLVYRDGGEAWRPMRPATALVRRINPDPYRFNTRRDAADTLRMCYPDYGADEVKIVEVQV